MPSLNGSRISTQNQRTDLHQCRSWISVTWRSSKSKTGCPMHTGLKTPSRCWIRGFVFSKKKTIKLPRNTTSQQTKTPSSMSLMRSWTWRLSRWNRNFRLWRRSTRRRSTNCPRSARSATTWSRWISLISRWPMTRSTLALMLPLTHSRLLSPSCSSNRLKTSNSLPPWTAQQIRLWRIPLSKIINAIIRTLFMRHQSCSSSWTTLIIRRLGLTALNRTLV